MIHTHAAANDTAAKWSLNRMCENGERGGINNFDVGKLDIPDYDDTSERRYFSFLILKLLNSYIRYLN